MCNLVCCRFSKCCWPGFDGLDEILGFHLDMLGIHPLTSTCDRDLYCMLFRQLDR